MFKSFTLHGIAGVLAVVCLSAFAGTASAQGQLYFTDLFNPDFETGSIKRVNTDGTGLTQLVNTGGGVRGLAVDQIGGKMYWADVNQSMIRRANLDGSGQEDLLQLFGSGEDFPFPSAITLHQQGGKMYWGDQVLGTMNRANLDGSGFEVLFATPFHRGVAVDSVNGKLYWSTSLDTFKGEIMRSNLDGSNPEVVVTSLDERFKPNKISLDILAGKIYWTDYTADIVRRSNLDGSGIETLYVPPFNRNPQGISLDLQGGKIYWGQDIQIEGHDGKIMSMNFDGSGAQDFMLGFGHVAEVVYVPVPEPLTLTIMAGGLAALIARRRVR